MDFTVCCIVFVFQCLNLFEKSDCEQINGRVRSLLSLRFERTMKDMRLANFVNSQRSGSSAETATFPFRCSATSDIPPPSSPPSYTLSIYTVPQHASPGQNERVQSLRRINPQPIHNSLQKFRAETAPTPLSGEGHPQKRVH